MKNEKAKRILKQYAQSRERLMRKTELSDEIEMLRVYLYEPATAKIKEEHELGSGGFNNAYKTPKLAQMDRLVEVEKEYNKLIELNTILNEHLNLMNEEIKFTIIKCYIEKDTYLNERAKFLGVTRLALYRNIFSEISRVYNL